LIKHHHTERFFKLLKTQHAWTPYGSFFSPASLPFGCKPIKKTWYSCSP
jgi:hypothetical protein